MLPARNIEDKSTNRLVDLWEIMHKYKIFHFVVIFQTLEYYQNKCQAMIPDQPEANVAAGLNVYTNALLYGGVSPVLSTKPSQEFIGEIVSFLKDEISPICNELDLTAAIEKIPRTVRYLENKSSKIDWSSLNADLRNVKDVLMTGLSKIWFIGIATALSRYADNSALFGEAVIIHFPETAEDIRSVGNCLAVELPTAAVFHLMRVSEHGLRRLAKELRVKVEHKGKPHPIEYADWEKVIDNINKRIAATRKQRLGPKREEKLQYYSNAADHCTFMKDLYRNPVSHTRKVYSPTEAMGVFERVHAFMQLLTKALG
jgi:hypothetical protein